MKSRFLNGVLPATISLLWLSSASWAGGTDDFGCSNATLKGEYAFGVTNYAFPLVVAGVRVYDGKGNFTERGYAGDSVPAQFSPPAGQPGAQSGTYHVDPDCTGSGELDLNVPVPSGSTGVVKFLFVISNGGRHIHAVVSEYTPPGSSGPVPAQTSEDDWKVASEQNSQ